MKRNRYIVYGFGLLLGLCISNNAEAQFLKHLFGKKEPKYHHKPIVHKKPLPKTTVTATKPVAKKQVINYPETVMKQRYRIDVLIPLYLNELVINDKPVYKTRIPEKAIPGIDFYQGLKLAADTLNAMHYNIDLYVHDITDPAQSIETLIHNKTLDSSDLIIGALQSHEIPAVAQLANKAHINFVSALSPTDGGVKDNPYFILSQPTLEAHCEWIVKHIVKKYNIDTIVLYHRTTVPTDESAYSYITKTADNNLAFKKVLCNNKPDPNELRKLFDSTRTNFIIMSVLDINYAERLLLQLHDQFPGYRFEVYGMPSWRLMPAIKKPDAFPNVTVDITSPFYFDISASVAQQLEKKYIKDYSGRPSELVYRAYETLFWYANLLTDYGTIFDTKLNDNKMAPFTKFEIRQRWDKNNNLLYNENQHIYLYKYQSSSYMVEQ